jgi:hypothetical protein
MARLAMLGKLTFVRSTNYYRSAEGHSTSRQSMIKKFGFNFFQATFFETYTAYLISKNLFKSTLVHEKYNLVKRMGIKVGVFFTINWKFLKNSIAKRVSK